MTCFFFDLFDGENLIEDNVGIDLADLSAAREQAQIIAFSRVGGEDNHSQAHDLRELRVREPAGQYVAKVAFRYISP